MAYSYTSKTVAEIKTIISNLEDVIANADTTGNQKIKYNNIEYEVQDLISDITSQIAYWENKLQIAEYQENVKSKVKTFTRGDGQC